MTKPVQDEEPPIWVTEGPPFEDANNVVDIERVRAERAHNSPRGVKYGNLYYLTDADAKDAKERDYFIKGILSPGEMSVWYGPPGCGKTFLVLSIARAIAQGRSMFERRVHGTNVLYMALEGVSGFEKRLKAEIQKHGEAEGFGYVAQPVNLFSDARARESIIAIIQATQTGIIIIDTLNRAIGEGSENDAADMGQFIQNVDAIRAATGCHVMIVHHSGKDVERGMRGHSALLGAADVAIEVARETESSLRTATIRKAKDDADGNRFGFYLDVVEMGEDQDGDEITTCTVREAPAEETTTTPQLRPAEQLWLDTIRELFARGEGVRVVSPEPEMAAIACATRDDIREWIKLRGLVGVAHAIATKGVLSATERSKFARMLETLKIKRKIGIYGNWIWLI